MALWDRAALWVRAMPWTHPAAPATPAHRTYAVVAENRTTEVSA